MIKAVFLAVLEVFYLDTSYAETRYLLPDSYELDTQGITRGITINKKLGGYVATINFTPSYRLAQNYIISESDLGDLPDVVELPLEVNGFDYLLKDSFGPNVLKNIAYEYFGQKFRIILDLTEDYSQDQINKILTFSTFYGLTSARVICTSGTIHELCDRKLPSIPTFNQFKLEENPEDQKSFQDFISLFEYRYQIAAKNNKIETTPTELDKFFRSDMIENGSCRSSLSTVKFGICNTVQRLSPINLSIYDSLRILGRELYKKDVGERELNKIAPILSVNEGHNGDVVKFEMRDHYFPWPGTSWSQTLPIEYPNFWSINWNDDTTSAADIIFSKDFYLANFISGFYFSNRINEFKPATGGFSIWTNSITGEAFRISGISRGSLVNGRIFTRFSISDISKISDIYLELLQRAPGASTWTSVKKFYQTSKTSKKDLDAGIFYAIENVFIPERHEVMMKFIVPPGKFENQKNQYLTLYLVELTGVKCPMDIWQNARNFCR